MLTLIGILLLGAFIITILNATPVSTPLWPAVLLICVILCLEHFGGVIR